MKATSIPFTSAPVSVFVLANEGGVEHLRQAALSNVGAQGPPGIDGIIGVNGLPGVAGATGPTGAAGPTGPTGPGGTATQWRSGNVAPSNALGLDGDFYLNVSTGNVYLRSAGVYNIIENINGQIGTTGATGATGPTGPTGPAGATFRDGAGAPSNGLGANGDYYLNDTNGDVYLRSAGTYSIVANIKGTTGATGATGATGPAYSFTHSVLTYASTTTIDFSSDPYRTETLTGDVTFASSNLAAGRAITVRIIGDSVQRALAFPAGWKFTTTKPTALGTSLTAILSVTAFGASDSNVIAAYVIAT